MDLTIPPASLDEAATPPVWLTTIIAAVFFGAVLALFYRVHQKRRGGLQTLAKEHQLDYDEDGGFVPLPQSLNLTAPGWWRLTWRVRESLEGALHGIPLWLFELRRYRGGGDISQQQLHGYPVVAAMIRLTDVETPPFVWKPTLLRRLLGRVSPGGVPIPERVRTALAAFSRDFPRYNVEGAEGHAVVYRRPTILRWQRLNAREAQRLMDACAGLVQRLDPPAS